MNKLKSINILIADDSTLNNQALKELLELQGASVESVENGQLLVERLCSHPEKFDIVLTDIDMPVLDGIKATKKVRQHDNLSALPIVAITGNTKPESQWRCFKAGMNGHVTKPIDLKKLCALITHLCAPLPSSAKDTSSISLDTQNQESLRHRILNRFDHNEELIVKMLEVYELEFDKQFNALKNTQSETSIQSILHAMKGISGTIGAEDVFLQVNHISSSLENDEVDLADLPHLIQRLKESNDKNLSELNTLFNVRASDKMMSCAEQTKQVLTEKTCTKIKSMLEENDLSVIAVVSKIKERHPSSKFVRQLYDYANQLRFTEALSMLIKKQYVMCDKE